MIKFKALIHKETGTVIKYEDWLDKLKNNNLIVWKDEKLNGTWQYKPQNILLSDDLEIIYDSEFTTDELKTIWCNADAIVDKYQHAKCESEKILKDKILKEYNRREKLKDKYGIEV